MSFKTDRLAALLPEVFASRDRDALLHRFIDALDADAAVKDLLKSHWINYSSDGGLDGLAALFGVERRRLPNGDPETDETFRPLIKSTVPSFVGGGTVEAIKGAVRAALGLPYNLTLLERQLTDSSGKLPDNAKILLDGLRSLVQIEEFAPKAEVVLGHAAPGINGSSVSLDVNFSTIQPDPPRIEWLFSKGSGRRLSLILEDTGAGIRSKPGFQVPQGATLLLANSASGQFTASIGTSDVSGHFTDIDGTSPPQLPAVPQGASRWTFSSGGSGFFDVSTFDQGQTFDAAEFQVRMAWLRYQPLVFDVIVPYFIDKAVQTLINTTQYQSRFNLFQGMSLDTIQRVVDRNRAAGVRGTVQYSLKLPAESTDGTPWEDHKVAERFSGDLENTHLETQAADESLLVGALENSSENHAIEERFAIGGVFGVAVFDGAFGFQ
jgi:hypothetical protein